MIAAPPVRKFPPWLRLGKVTLAAAGLAIACSSHGTAQTERAVRPQNEADRHLRSCSAGNIDTRRRCETGRQTFLRAYAGAFRGEYDAQRMVARLLAAAAGSQSAQTPSSAVIPDQVEACAWRRVLINQDQLDPRDEARERRDCNRLMESDRLAANLRASELMLRIGNARGAVAPERRGDCGDACGDDQSVESADAVAW